MVIKYCYNHLFGNVLLQVDTEVFISGVIADDVKFFPLEIFFSLFFDQISDSDC